MKVLLADDDRVLTHLLSTRLGAKGAQITVAHDAMQALMTAMRSPPDVIVLDIQMPGGTGIEALRKLKRSARTSTIPVVVLSGSVAPDASEAVKALGAVEFILKPVDPDVLYQVLCAVLKPQERAG
ncbi:MAG: two-component system, response regulator RegA [Gemmatimonadales bacterium]|jgi:CheY-like chemotaxis protein|nr:two-component system, response regulator RegA [Gemmatimonadales bacterium]